MSSSFSSSLASLSSFLPRPRFLPPFHHKIHSLAVFDPSITRICSVGIEFLGSSDPSRTRIYSRRSSGRRGRRKEDDHQEDAFAMGQRSIDMEAEIYEFMQRSAKPTDFPTREELIAAGRADLVEAVAAQGGWLTFGWNVDGDEVIDGLESRSVFAEEDGRIYQERVSNGSLVSDPVVVISSEDCPPIPSSSGRLSETENVEVGGIEGMLSRLEKERSLSLAMASRGKLANGQDSWKNAVHDPGDTILVSHKLAIGGNERNSRPESSESENFFLHDSGGVHSQNGKSKDNSGTKSSTPDMWRNWSLQRAGFSMTEFEAAEIVPTDTKMSEDYSLDVDCRSNNMLKQPQNAFKSGNGIDELAADRSHIHMRLQHLEADLTSALHSLSSRINDAVSQKHQQNSIDELHRLSDTWEFQETEMMNARDKLRSIRAKLAVLEGKLSLEIIEAKKAMEEKQKRLDYAKSALCLLCTTCIIWPSFASEVLLAGSFDGWTSQRKMERSSSGIFSLQLKLYPGRYEIKFIVDGVWKSDPLRPVVHNNGHENNLLIIH